MFGRTGRAIRAQVNAAGNCDGLFFRSFSRVRVYVLPAKNFNTNFGTGFSRLLSRCGFF
jgi:hypothetical protein